MSAKIESLFVRNIPEPDVPYKVFGREKVVSAKFTQMGFEGSPITNSETEDPELLKDRSFLCQCADSYEELKQAFPKLADHFEAIKHNAGFGENITLSGVNVDDVFVGDVFQLQRACGGVGDRITFVVVSPRRPCSKVDTKHGKLLKSKQFTNDGVRHHVAVTALGGFFMKIIGESSSENDEVYQMSVGDKFVKVSSLNPGWTLRVVAEILYGAHDKLYNPRWTSSEQKLDTFINLTNLAVLEWKDVAMECKQKFVKNRIKYRIGVGLVAAVSIYSFSIYYSLF